MNKTIQRLMNALSAGGARLCALCLLALLVIASCASAPLKITYAPPASKPLPRSVTLTVEPFVDSRTPSALTNPRTIGDINAAVIDIYEDTLTLSENPADIVTDAFVEELKGAGYAVRTGAGQDGSDFIISGEIKEFKLDIGSKDRIDIKVAAKITQRDTGKIVWKGMGIAKEERFAGVMGNTGATISKYISASVSKAVRQAITDAELYDNYLQAPATAPGKPSWAALATGKLVINTNPQHGKVYLNGVYYGLTPLDSECETGIYELTIKLDGFKEEKEKISVRKGQTTEIEMRLEKK